MPSAAEVANKAGVAKGTVYLYFPSKEEMPLALHELHVERFFAQLGKKPSEPGPLDFDDIFPITRDHMIRVPGYLALTSRCFGMMDREIPLTRPSSSRRAWPGSPWAGARGSSVTKGPARRRRPHPHAQLQRSSWACGNWCIPTSASARRPRPELKLLMIDYETERKKRCVLL
jgi:AcrR family transcriptional regulator